jgi:hypothetical protein
VSNSVSATTQADDHRASKQTRRKFNSFRDYYLGTIFRPRETFDALMADERRNRYGIIAIAITVQLYVLLYLFLSLGETAFSILKPWLTLPAASFHHYNDFFLAPSLFICWILAAGVAQLFSRACSGRGSFEDMLSVLGFGISIASLPALLIDLPESALGAMGIVDVRSVEAALSSQTIWHEAAMLLYGLSITWCVVLFCIGIGAGQRIRRAPAVIVGLFAYFIYQVVLMMFNR